MKPDCVSLGSVVLGSKLANAGWGQLGRLWDARLRSSGHCFVGSGSHSVGKESRSPPLLLESNGKFALSQEGACLMPFPWVLKLLHPHSHYTHLMSSKSTIKITKNPLSSESVLSKSLAMVLRRCEGPVSPGQLLSVSLWPAASAQQFPREYTLWHPWLTSCALNKPCGFKCSHGAFLEQRGFLKQQLRWRWCTSGSSVLLTRDWIPSGPFSRSLLMPQRPGLDPMLASQVRAEVALRDVRASRDFCLGNDVMWWAAMEGKGLVQTCPVCSSQEMQSHICGLSTPIGYNWAHLPIALYLILYKDHIQIWAHWVFTPQETQITQNLWVKAPRLRGCLLDQFQCPVLLLPLTKCIIGWNWILKITKADMIVQGGGDRGGGGAALRNSSQHAA